MNEATNIVAKNIKKVTLHDKSVIKYAATRKPTMLVTMNDPGRGGYFSVDCITSIFSSILGH